MGLQRFPIGDFRGGVNFKADPAALRPNEAQDLLNVLVDEEGNLRSREGKKRFDQSGLLAPVDHLRNWYFGGSRKLLGSAGGSIVASGGTGHFVRLHTGVGVWDIETAQDKDNNPFAWFMNGEIPQKWDGHSAGTVDWGGTPPHGTMCRVWKNRMIVATGGTRLAFSEIANPESFPANNFIDIKSTEDDLDPITWIDTLEDYLIVFKKQSVWAVHDPTNFTNRRLGGPGCEGRFMSAVSRGRAYFLNRRGIWSTDGLHAPRYESMALEPWLRDNLGVASLDKARMGASKDERVLVSVPIGSGTKNSRLLELTQTVQLDGGGSPWLIHDLEVSSLCTFRPRYGDEILAGESTSHKVHRLFVGDDDEGVDINAFWFTGWKPIVSEEPYERLRRLNFVLRGTVTTEVFNDFESTPKFSKELTSEVIDPVDPLWSGGTWDGGVWDSQGITVEQFKRIRPEVRGRFHAIKFSSNAPFKVVRAEISLRGGKEH